MSRSAAIALAAFGIAVAPAGALASNQHDAGIWLVLSTSGALGGNAGGGPWRYWFDAHARFFELGSGTDQFLVRPAIGYAVAGNARLWLGYARVQTKNRANISFDEDRFWQQLDWRAGDWLGGAWTWRARLEQRSLSLGDDVGITLRMMARYTRPLDAAGTTSLIIGVEPFLDLRDTDWGASRGISQNRAHIGIGWRPERADVDRGRLHEPAFLSRRQGRSEQPSRRRSLPGQTLTDARPPHRRTVRSFVRRAGRLTASQQRALDELWLRFGVDFAPRPLDFALLFGRTAPVVVEIGFGNGETLVEQAAARPQCDFLGVEVHEPGVGHCLIRAREADVSNLRLIMHDALEVLARQIPRASLCRVNLYFPDPWPKKRHHKRRIVQAPFLDLVADCLETGGTLHIATDWADYGEHIDSTLARDPRFVCRERREHAGDAPLDRPETKFERRGLSRGHRILDWCYERV